MMPRYAVPGVSVTMPTFDRTAFLKQAVDSVLAQTFDDWEMVLADDGSGDETREYLRSIAGPKVRIVWLEHRGNPSSVRNAAIAVARGRCIAFLGSDDTRTPAKLDEQLAAHRSRPRCHWSYAKCGHTDEQGRVLESGQRRVFACQEGMIFAALLKL